MLWLLTILQIQFSFTPTPPVESYQLYADQQLVCEATTDTQEFECEVDLNGEHDFTMKAVYEDQSESPASPLFPYYIFQKIEGLTLTGVNKT